MCTMRLKKKVAAKILTFFFGGMCYFVFMSLHFNGKQNVFVTKRDAEYFISTHSNYVPTTEKITTVTPILIKDGFTRIGPNATNTTHHRIDAGLPLKGSLSLLKPGLEFGSIDNNSDLIIGITTIKREGADYLLSTLESLVNNTEAGNKLLKIVVYIGETNTTYVKAKYDELHRAFGEQFDQRSIQVISPPSDYYPKWELTLGPSFGDSFDRVKWRSKQNLDQVFLMMHIYNLSPTYYLMLEDDIIASKDYLKQIFYAIEQKGAEEWLVISFCNLGAIGKLFRTSMLATYSSFIYTFWNRKPLDWLQIDFANTLYCSYDESEKLCLERRKKKMLSVKPSLFQHVGKHSSLKGKTQNLKDLTFKSNP